MQRHWPCDHCLSVSYVACNNGLWVCEDCGKMNKAKSELKIAVRERERLLKERETMNVGDEMIGKHMMPELDKCLTDLRSAEYAKVYDKPKPDTIGTGYHGKGDPTTFTKPSNSMVDVAKDMHSKALNRQNKRLVKENQDLRDVIVMLVRKMHGQESYAEFQDVMIQAMGKGKGE